MYHVEGPGGPKTFYLLYPSEEPTTSAQLFGRRLGLLCTIYHLHQRQGQYCRTLRKPQSPLIIQIHIEHNHDSTESFWTYKRHTVKFYVVHIILFFQEQPYN